MVYISEEASSPTQAAVSEVTFSKHRILVSLTGHIGVIIPHNETTHQHVKCTIK